MMVYSDHGGDKTDRCSRTGYMIFVNMALIDWLSKKQATVEKAVSGSEFVAMTHGVETLCGLPYKLRMMGVFIYGPTYVYGENMSVIFNTPRPKSQLNKKSNSVCYHAFRESVAMGECITKHIPPLLNFSDLLTKVLYDQKRRNLVDDIIFDINEYELN